MKKILITGGTGSFGQAFVAELLRSFPKIQRLVVFSRDELKQFEMAQKFYESKHKNLRLLVMVEKKNYYFYFSQKKKLFLL